MPLNINFTAIERAVTECAAAGCDSIWITVSREYLPLIRKVLGDYIHDPLYYFNMRKVKYAADYLRRIPIFYCPMRIKDIGLKDSEAFGIINSALCARKLSIKLSGYVEPMTYYAAFYDGVYQPFVSMPLRDTIRKEKNFYYSYNGKSFKDGEPLAFTFNHEQLKACHEMVRNEGTKKYKPLSEYKADNSKWLELLPKEERYSATKFKLDKVFSSVTLDASHEVKLRWFHNINTWEGYRAYVAGHTTIRRPKKNLKPSNNLERI